MLKTMNLVGNTILIKKIKLLALLTITILASSLLCGRALAQEVRLVGNKVETFINDRGQPSRLTNLVSAALADVPHNITATTQAWSGSGLRNGRFDGYLDHYSLNHQQQTYVYSAPYVTLYLHVASTDNDAVDMVLLDQLNRKRVGIETRFANTDQVRSERSVNWARTQDFLSNIEQLAEQRVNYLVADKLMLDEMNKMLVAIDQEPLYISEKPLFIVDVTLGMRNAYERAEEVIEAFDAGIERLRSTEEYDEIYTPTPNAKSILDEALYQEILKRW